jgi:hypothetical protein
MSNENIMRLFNDCVTGGRVRPLFKVVAKTASYTITSDDFGTVFTTRGAAAEVEFTLPAAASTNKGEWVLFLNAANQNMSVAGAEAGLIVFNSLTADNISFRTDNERIGGGLLAISDGTSWIVLPIATETQTIHVDAKATSSASATSTTTATGTSSSSVTATTTATKTATATATATA